MTGAVAASLPREYLALLGGQLLKGAHVLVVDLADLVPAEPALALLAVARLALLSGASGFASAGSSFCHDLSLLLLRRCSVRIRPRRGYRPRAGCVCYIIVVVYYSTALCTGCIC